MSMWPSPSEPACIEACIELLPACLPLPIYLQAREQLQQRDSDTEKLSSTFDDTARFLLMCMAEVREKIVTIVREEKEGVEEVELSVLPGKHKSGRTAYSPMQSS